MKLANEQDPLETSAIRNRQDFARFLSRLLIDYQINGKDWENQNLGDFLEALAAYATDIDGYYLNISSTDELAVNANVASWRVFADMLRGATIYE
ncbi:hypothetical protein [Hymenobacter nivis]|uniref:DUF7660 family protein n=1 Tax=Hymenobacter nivis TaxID=1850093 RepID=UPI00112BA189|nr:hypothetical protein [Hymenobacter nivis]